MNRFKRVFFPHQDNDYTPDLLQRSALVLMGALVILSFTMSNVYALFWQSSAWLVGAVLPAVIVAETNDERDDINLPALVRNPVLDEAAQLKAEHMASQGYFAHYSPDGVSPWHWFNEANYPFVHAGENLAVHFTDSKEVVDAWMHSPTHRANIVNGNYREIGVGTAKGRFEGYDTVFVVQLFGTPAILSADNDFPAIAVSPEVLPTTEVVNLDIEPDTQIAGAEIDLVEVIETDEQNDNIVSSDPIVPAVPMSTKTLVEEHGAIIYSDTIATSTNLPEAALVTTATPEEPSVFASLATSPSTLLQRIYLGLGGLAIIILILSVAMEWRFQRPRQVLYGVFLLCLMSALFYLHTWVTGGSLIV